MIGTHNDPLFQAQAQAQTQPSDIDSKKEAKDVERRVEQTISAQSSAAVESKLAKLRERKTRKSPDSTQAPPANTIPPSSIGAVRLRPPSERTLKPSSQQASSGPKKISSTTTPTPTAEGNPSTFFPQALATFSSLQRQVLTRSRPSKTAHKTKGTASLPESSPGAGTALHPGSSIATHRATAEADSSDATAESKNNLATATGSATPDSTASDPAAGEPESVLAAKTASVEREEELLPEEPTEQEAPELYAIKHYVQSNADETSDSKAEGKFDLTHIIQSNPNQTIQGYPLVHLAIFYQNNALLAELAAQPTFNFLQRTAGGEVPFQYALRMGNWQAAHTLYTIDQTNRQEITFDTSDEQGFRPADSILAGIVKQGQTAWAIQSLTLVDLWLTAFYQSHPQQFEEQDHHDALLGRFAEEIELEEIPDTRKALQYIHSNLRHLYHQGCGFAVVTTLEQQTPHLFPTDSLYVYDCTQNTLHYIAHRHSTYRQLEAQQLKSLLSDSQLSEITLSEPLFIRLNAAQKNTLHGAFSINPVIQEKFEDLMAVLPHSPQLDLEQLNFTADLNTKDNAAARTLLHLTIQAYHALLGEDRVDFLLCHKAQELILWLVQASPSLLITQCVMSSKNAISYYTPLQLLELLLKKSSKAIKSSQSQTGKQLKTKEEEEAKLKTQDEALDQSQLALNSLTTEQNSTTQRMLALLGEKCTAAAARAELMGAQKQITEQLEEISTALHKDQEQLQELLLQLQQVEQQKRTALMSAQPVTSAPAPRRKPFLCFGPPPLAQPAAAAAALHHMAADSLQSSHPTTTPIEIEEALLQQKIAQLQKQITQQQQQIETIGKRGTEKDATITEHTQALQTIDSEYATLELQKSRIATELLTTADLNQKLTIECKRSRDTLQNIGNSLITSDQMVQQLEFGILQLTLLASSLKDRLSIFESQEAEAAQKLEMRPTTTVSPPNKSTIASSVGNALYAVSPPPQPHTPSMPAAARRASAPAKNPPPSTTEDRLREAVQKTPASSLPGEPAGTGSSTIDADQRRAASELQDVHSDESSGRTSDISPTVDDSTTDTSFAVAQAVANAAVTQLFEGSDSDSSTAAAAPVAAGSAPNPAHASTVEGSVAESASSRQGGNDEDTTSKVEERSTEKSEATATSINLIRTLQRVLPKSQESSTTAALVTAPPQTSDAAATASLLAASVSTGASSPAGEASQEALQAKQRLAAEQEAKQQQQLQEEYQKLLAELRHCAEATQWVIEKRDTHLQSIRLAREQIATIRSAPLKLNEDIDAYAEFVIANSVRILEGLQNRYGQYLTQRAAIQQTLGLIDSNGSPTPSIASPTPAPTTQPWLQAVEKVGVWDFAEAQATQLRDAIDTAQHLAAAQEAAQKQQLQEEYQTLSRTLRHGAEAKQWVAEKLDTYRQWATQTRKQIATIGSAPLNRSLNTRVDELAQSVEEEGARILAALQNHYERYFAHRAAIQQTLGLIDSDDSSTPPTDSPTPDPTTQPWLRAVEKDVVWDIANTTKDRIASDLQTAISAQDEQTVLLSETQRALDAQECWITQQLKPVLTQAWFKPLIEANLPKDLSAIATMTSLINYKIAEPLTSAGLSEQVRATQEQLQKAERYQEQAKNLLTSLASAGNHRLCALNAQLIAAQPIVDKVAERNAQCTTWIATQTEKLKPETPAKPVVQVLQKLAEQQWAKAIEANESIQHWKALQTKGDELSTKLAKLQAEIKTLQQHLAALAPLHPPIATPESETLTHPALSREWQQYEADWEKAKRFAAQMATEDEKRDTNPVSAASAGPASKLPTAAVAASTPATKTATTRSEPPVTSTSSMRVVTVSETPKIVQVGAAPAPTPAPRTPAATPDIAIASPQSLSQRDAKNEENAAALAAGTTPQGSSNPEFSTPIRDAISLSAAEQLTKCGTLLTNIQGKIARNQPLPVDEVQQFLQKTMEAYKKATKENITGWRFNNYQKNLASAVDYAKGLNALELEGLQKEANDLLNSGPAPAR